MHDLRCDILVIGAGPAGMAAAVACAARGLRTIAVAPDPKALWPSNYGAWEDEVAALELVPGERFACPLHVRWPEVEAWLSEGERAVLPRAYARLDRRRLQDALVDRLAQAGGRLVAGEVAGLEPDDAGTTVHLAGGGRARAAVVVDATGHGPRFVRRVGRDGGALQVAYGQLLRVDEHPFDPGRMVFMDWRQEPLGDAGGSPPTFLYAMPFDEETIFLEETSLIAEPAVSIDLLAARLRRRIAALGISPREVLEEERCFIRMTPAMPDLRQRVVGFGAAASMVHPASGYLVARALRAAPALAAALAGGLASGPTAAARAAWRALWPRSQRQSRELYLLGAELLCRLDTRETQAFFRAFFRLPPDQQAGYLSGALPPAGVAGAMLRLFPRLEPRLQAAVLGAGARHAGRLLKTLALSGR